MSTDSVPQDMLVNIQVYNLLPLREEESNDPSCSLKKFHLFCMVTRCLFIKSASQMDFDFATL